MLKAQYDRAEAMKGKVISVWLNKKELARYEAEAARRNMSVSTFLKLCADEVIAGPEAELKALAGDIRADIAKSISRLVEAAALASENERANHEAFLNELFEQQVDVVKKAVATGQQSAISGRLPSSDFPPPRSTPSL